MAFDPAVINLFSGAGGWEEGARWFGVRPLGIEDERDAIATAIEAGHEVQESDVAALDPIDFGPCDLLIASPPCQAWSVAGNGGGSRDIAHVHAVTDWMTGRRPPPDLQQPWADERSRLVTEPLRWALALQPRWIALEQVPPVLDYWRHLADVLREQGYSCWAGLLRSECWGVPQTRKRAILMADRDAPVCPPRPTHQRYVPGEPQRHEHTLEGELLPWVSMAQALAIARDADGKRSKAGSVPYERPATEPAPVVACAPGEWRWRNGNQPNAAVREQDQPAPTIHFGHNLNCVEWVAQRPATTVNADPRISAPGHHDPEESGSQQRDAVQVTVEEAALLQGFPADYPWQGSRTSRFRQIGNAIPPPLATAILDALMATWQARA